MIVPFFNPGIGAECVKVFEEKLTGSVVFALQIDTTMVVNIILPAIPESDKQQVFNFKLIPTSYEGSLIKLTWFGFGWGIGGRREQSPI